MENETQRDLGLLDFFILILKHKLLIFSVALIGTVTLSAYAFLHYKGNTTLQEALKISDLYYSECIIEPDGISAERLKATLMGWEVTRRVIETNSLMPVIKDVVLNKNSRLSIASGRVHLNNIRDLLLKQLSYKNENGVIKLTFFSSSEEYPTKMLKFYLHALSDVFREAGLPGIERSKRALYKQMQADADPVLKSKLSERMAYLIEVEERAREAPYYGFTIIDPPSPAMIQMDQIQDSVRTRPNYVILVILFALASFIVALFLVFCIERLEKAKIQDPERYEQFKKYLHFRAK